MSGETVFVSVGSNIEAAANVRRALELLSKSTSIVAVSTFYHTEAIERPDQPNYLNGVVKLRTDLPPGRLRDLLKEVEHALGRVRTDDPYAARTIDLDILLYNTAIVSDNGLEIPDPDIRERVFLAAGLLELDELLCLPGESEPLSRQIDLDSATLVAAMELTRELKEKYS